MSSATSEDDNQEPVESGFKTITTGEQFVSAEKVMGEIFQNNLEENTDIDELEKEMKRHGLKPEAFPGICLKLGLQQLQEEGNPYTQVFEEEIPDKLVLVEQRDIQPGFQHESKWAKVPRGLLSDAIQNLDDAERESLVRNLKSVYEDETGEEVAKV